MSKKSRLPGENPVQWEQKLPAVYTTILEGFHAGLTVKEMAEYLNIDVAIPEAIKDIKIGSFTPHAFDYPDFAALWQTAVPRDTLSPEILAALDDPDIAEVQAHVKYKVDTAQPTLETLCRVAQTQYAGYHSRMGELTSTNMFERFGKLNDPQFYKDLKNSPFVRANNLQAFLPEKVPQFQINTHKHSVKGVKSGMEKAYERTGNPTIKTKDVNGKKTTSLDIDKFLNEHHKHGVFAITDMQRTKLQLNRAVGKDAFFKNYTDMCNILTVLLLSGDLGAVVDWEHHGELTDQVRYPKSTDLKDLLPVFISKFTLYHAGPNGSYLALPAEIQIPLLDDGMDTRTHDLYKRTRKLQESGADPEMLALWDAERYSLFCTPLSAKAIEEQMRYAKTQKMTNHDPFYMLIEKMKITRLQEGVRRYALSIAYEEFNDPMLKGKDKVIELNPFVTNMNQITRTTMKRMINADDDPNSCPIARSTDSRAVKQVHNLN